MEETYEFENFYGKHLSLVHAVALSHTRDEARADDLAQEVFLRAWKHFTPLSAAPVSAQRAWLLTTLRNLAIDSWRKSRFEAPYPAEARQPPAPEPELGWELVQAISDLEPGDRELVILRYLQGMNSREIGESMGIPDGTVRRRLSECRKFLARRLEPWAREGGGR